MPLTHLIGQICRSNDGFLALVVCALANFLIRAASFPIRQSNSRPVLPFLESQVNTQSLQLAFHFPPFDKSQGGTNTALERNSKCATLEY